MKKLYIYVLLFLAIAASLVGAAHLYRKDNVLEVKETYSSLAVTSSSVLKEANEETDNMKILVYYPCTTYQSLNDNITENLEKIVNDFKYNVQNINEEISRKCELSINFDSYEYNDYVSYAFYITEDILKAHPSNYIMTINYDTKKDEIITIDTITESNADVLNKLSKYCYNEISKDQRMIEYGNLEQLKVGTAPDSNNFRNIVFTKTGLLVFFEKYSVGPYVLGEFSVNVPYDELK